MDLKSLIAKMDQIEKKQILQESAEIVSKEKIAQEEIETESQDFTNSIAQALLKEFDLEEGPLDSLKAWHQKNTADADAKAQAEKDMQNPANIEAFKKTLTPSQLKWVGNADLSDPIIRSRIPKPLPAEKAAATAAASAQDQQADMDASSQGSTPASDLAKANAQDQQADADASSQGSTPAATAQASAQKPDAQPTAQAASGGKGSKPVAAAATTQEKMDRFVYLMKKKKEAGASAGTAQTAQSSELELPPGAEPEAGYNVAKAESISYLISKLKQLEESVVLEALTPEEEKELQDLSKEVVGTVQSGAEGIPPEVAQAVKDFQGGAAGAGTAQAAATPAAGGVDPKVQNVQKQLVALGIDIGKTGADGKMGPATTGGIKAFEKMAGKPETGKITPELEQLLAKGPQIKSQNDLVASIDALEKILTKYKAESIDNDVDSMTEDELKSFVMQNIKLLSETEKMEVLRLIVSEAGPRSPEQQAAMAVASGQQLPSQLQAANARFPAGGAAPAAGAPAAQPSKLAQFGKNLMQRVTGAGGGAKGAVKAGAKMGARLLPGIGWGLLAWDVIGAAVDALKDPSVQLDPADKAELDKHNAVLKKYLADPEAASGLPKDIQQRLTAVNDKMQKLAGAKTAAPAAAPQGSTASGELSGMPSAEGQPEAGAGNSQPVSGSQQTSGTLIANEPVVPGKPLSQKQMAVMQMAISSGNKYPPEIMAQYNKQKTQ